ncbi:MAG: tetratricopeptide repeat protein [bacterium]|nr:tetratricopeptide repeat protein [bacterium]
MAKRVLKKELKKKDRFIEKGIQFFVWTRKHKIQVSSIIVGILVIGIVLMWFYYSMQTKQKKANHEFFQALTAYGIGNMEEALTRFEDISRLYPRTEPGIKSIYWLGNIYYFQGRYKEARNKFQEYLKRGKDIIILPGALLGVGDTYMQEGDYFSASQKYEELVTRYPNSSLIPRALFQGLRCYQFLNQPERVKSIIQTLTKNHPNSPYTRKAQSLIINLM